MKKLIALVSLMVSLTIIIGCGHTKSNQTPAQPLLVPEVESIQLAAPTQPAPTETVTDDISVTMQSIADASTSLVIPEKCDPKIKMVTFWVGILCVILLAMAWRKIKQYRAIVNKRTDEKDKK